MTRCEADHECNGDEYCYHTGYCVECIDCSTYRRSPPEYISCPKDPLECGSCLPGFEEEILTDLKPRDRCMNIQKTNENFHHPLTWIVVCAIFGILIVFLVFSVIFVFFWRKRNKGNSQRELSSRDAIALIGLNHNASENGNLASTEISRNVFSGDSDKGSPPPYTEISPSAPYLESQVNGQEVCVEVNEPIEQVHYYKHGKEENCLEGAQPYHRASYPYDNSSEEDEDDMLTGLISPPMLHEEETVESTWAPPVNYNVQRATGYSQQESSHHEPVLKEVNNTGILNSASTSDRPFAHLNSTSVEESNSCVNDLGILHPSCQSSNSSISDPFVHLNSANNLSEEEEEEEDMKSRGSLDEKVKSDIVDSGILHSPSQNSNSSITGSLMHLDSPNFLSTEAVSSRGIIRSISDEDVSSRGAAKRQRHDSGTQSLGSATNDDCSSQ